MNLGNNKYSIDLRRYYKLPATQVSLTVVMSLFVIAIFVVFALRPTLISIATLKKNIAESKKTLTILESKTKNLEKVAIELSEIEQFLPSLNRSIPNDGADQNELTAEMELIASQSGVKMENVALGSSLIFSEIVKPFVPNKYQKVIPLSLTIRVSGEFNAITNFLDAITKIERLISIDSVAIARETTSKTSGEIISMNLTANVFYMADEAQLQKTLIEPKGK